ncbi:MAG: aspartate-semialdehyde dehydrogenase [Candidatus Marinimicrobia bacterium]|nr:aspartate-semialdehyde dehydrogenase [Candidatus Neomarinimicrobiota bacterium]MCF7828369.1 aspartate-semialdehyde dehydrogenase [Candidatus Neomarinimicrobiota bacterium]MCF7881037.1 aspartate-semialdehyde dehydrogenase [Candidatus Neomarinimicrobiota bacterium]
MNEKKIPVGILGATGMVGQRFVTLLADHPWFEIVNVAASARSAGQTYAEAVDDRWTHNDPIPANVAGLEVYDAVADREKIAAQVAFVFSAMSLDKAQVRKLETDYAASETPVISNNSAHRWTEDVPIFIPEVNHSHTDLIDIQRKNHGWRRGFITAKPNCSIQSYVPILAALKEYEPEQVIVSTYQAISGAGKTFETYPEITDNVIPYISGEEEKSEQEPLKVMGNLNNGRLEMAEKPAISATCIRVPVVDGHLAAVQIKFGKPAEQEELIEAIRSYDNPIAALDLPSAPDPFLTYFNEDDRPQTKLDRDIGNGMGIAVGRLREDPILDYKFVALSHNTIRGAAGGAVLTAEMLVKKGYLD